MEVLYKVTNRQIFQLWRNIAISYIAVIAIILLGKYMPVYLSPIISMLLATSIYMMIMKFSKGKEDSCMITMYASFITLLLYTIVLITLNILYTYELLGIITEFIFLHRPFKPILLLAPIALIVSVYMYRQKSNMSICIDCKLRIGDSFERGAWGAAQKYESYAQLKNSILVFSVIIITTWGYYLSSYKNTSIDTQDTFVFIWVTIIFIVIDMIYFFVRYYNLYLDLKESNQIFLPEENLKKEQTYIRYYLICGNHIYITRNSSDNSGPGKIDTPFFIKVDKPRISLSQADDMIKKISGVDNGELRFFYGRISQKPRKNKMLRYFYFLDGDIDQYKITTEGEWINYDEVKEIYGENPDILHSIFIADTSRVARILIAEKTYDSRGRRKMTLSNYTPTYDLFDLYNSTLDFQNDKWIRISLLNSDSRLFRIRRLMRLLFRYKTNSNTPPTKHDA